MDQDASSDAFVPAPDDAAERRQPSEQQHVEELPQPLLLQHQQQSEEPRRVSEDGTAASSSTAAAAAADSNSGRPSGNAATVAAVTPVVAPAPAPAPVPVAESIQIVMLRRELARAETQLAASRHEAGELAARNALLQEQLAAAQGDGAARLRELQDKLSAAVAASNSSSGTGKDGAAPRSDLAALGASLAAAAPAASTVDVLVAAERAVARSIALQERVEFLETLAQSAMETSALWQRIARRSQTASTAATTTTVRVPRMDDAPLSGAGGDAASYAAALPPEAAKLAATCGQVTALLEERAAVAAADGNWRAVMEQLRDALSRVLADNEMLVKQLTVARAAVRQSAHFCVESAVVAQTASARAADMTLRAQYAAGSMALRAVRPAAPVRSASNHSSSGSSSSGNNASATALQYYRCVLASVLSAPSASAAPQSVNELAFLRRLAAEYHARCQQLEAQCREFKHIAETCARFFGPTATQQQQHESHALTVASTSSIASSSSSSSSSSGKTAHQAAINLWRDCALVLFRALHEVVERSSAAAGAAVADAATAARCAALEAVAAAQERRLAQLGASCASLTQLACSAAWLPAVLEACIPTAGGSEDGAAASAAPLQQIAADLAALVDRVRGDVAASKSAEQRESTAVAAQYEQQLTALEAWHAQRFDGQRVRHNALVQMLRGADAALCAALRDEEDDGSSSSSADAAANHSNKHVQPAAAQSWSALLSSRPTVFSSVQQSRKNFVPLLAPAAATPGSDVASSSSTSTLAQTLQHTVDTLAREFRARRTQLENRLHALTKTDVGALHAQLEQLQERLQAEQAQAGARIEGLEADNAALQQQCADHRSLSERHELLLKQVGEMQQQLQATADEQRRRSVSHRHEDAANQGGGDGEEADVNGDVDGDVDVEGGDDDDIIEEVVVFRNSNSRGPSASGAVSAEHHEQHQQHGGADDADHSAADAAGHEHGGDAQNEGDDADEEEHDEERDAHEDGDGGGGGAANPFTSSFFG